MSKSEFDDDFLRLVEEFNKSAGAVERRSRILAWVDDLLELGASGDYFFNSNEYIFTAGRP